MSRDLSEGPSALTGNQLAKELDDTIRENAQGPSEASRDSGSMTQHSLRDQMRTFLRNVKDGETPHCTPEYAMHIVNVIQSAYESSRTGKKIAVP